MNFREWVDILSNFLAEHPEAGEKYPVIHGDVLSLLPTATERPLPKTFAIYD